MTISDAAGFRLAWAQRYCPQADYVIKADDDTYLYAGLLPRILSEQAEARRNTGVGVKRPRSVFVGSLNVNATVQRSGRWKVSKNSFPRSIAAFEPKLAERSSTTSCCNLQAFRASALI